MDNVLENLEDVEVIYSDGEDEESSEPMEEVDQLPEVDVETEVVDLANLTFTKHTKSVFASAVSEDGTLAITGGEDDTAFVWDTNSGEVVFECSGHKDSVTAVGFNYNNKYVATGDMAGLIQIWSLKEHKLMWCFEADDMEWLTWHPLTNVIFCGCQSGDVYMWQMPSGNCKVLPAPGYSQCTHGTIAPNGKNLLTGYENGHIKLWDLKETTALWTNSENTTVNSLEISPDGSLAIAIPSASIIKVNDGKIIANILLEGETEIETAIFNNEIVVTGALSGQICVWQLGKFAVRHQAKIDCAVTILKWSNTGNAIVGTTDGNVFICNIKSGVLVQNLTGHKSDILSISLFKGANKILTTSDDTTAKIFEISNSNDS